MAHEKMAQHVSLWRDFLSKNQKIEFVWVQLLSYSGKSLIRMIPVVSFDVMVRQNLSLPFPKAALCHLPGTCHVLPQSMSGPSRLVPDLATLYPQAGSDGTRAVVIPYCADKSGKRLPECPRSRLEALCEMLQKEMGYSALIGIEVEVVFVKLDEHNGTPAYKTVNHDHSWSSMTIEDRSFLHVIEAVVRALMDVDVRLVQFHAETAPGQWEFVLPPSPPIQAADVFIKTRDTIRDVAAEFGLHATFYPRISPNDYGTGSHAHISLQHEGEGNPATCEAFFSGILAHLPSILAFTLPRQESYDRIGNGIRAGGDFVGWGWENKETPLRRIEENHFEFRLLDGFANPFLALLSIFAAGISGIKRGLILPPEAGSLVQTECLSKEHHSHSIPLPKVLEESLDSLGTDKDLRDMIGPEIVQSYIPTKLAEEESMKRWSASRRKQWLISEY
ncbi:FluG family protein [Penicillium argentinense]|uniref:FluG family protein n=1 Tax=Penicillium argentinense TaxID=1131581 RepID=A0A9W9EHN6_9EURO|nr:FluG family protein [Penicillium argentinense]KAJ5082017.1 FluG family protein [Penicillium argentinense]